MPMQRSLLLLFLLLSSVLTVTGADDSKNSDSAADIKYEPTSSYEKQSIAGFNVFVSAKLSKHPEQAKKALELLTAKLEEIGRIVPKEKVDSLRKANIWVEWALSPVTAAQTHHSVDWLRSNGYNPDKVRGVEISNASFFLAWSDHQPMMVLHELAHFYHQNYLGSEKKRDVDAAYNSALKGGTYASVEYVLGGKKKAYALTNSFEYFAELTEAYFGRNDFYPFDYEQLSTHDPVGFQLMVKSWGELKK